MEDKKILDIDLEMLKRYKIKGKNLLNAIEGAKKMLDSNSKLETRLFGSDVALFLQISLFQVPRKIEKQLKRLKLKHSLYKKDADICLIVPEVKGIDTKDHEKHIEHYEDLLKKKGVSKIKKIMTFHEFRTEYENFELRSSLVSLYDVFLVDGRISGKVVRKCGKIFYKKRKVPMSIKLQATNLKQHLDETLKKTPLHVHTKGNCYAVQFGSSNMHKKKLIENMVSLIGQFDANVPGGFQNISGVLVNSEGSTSVPLYKSLENPSNIKLETEKSHKVKAFKTVTGELSTMINRVATVTPFGKVKVTKPKKKKLKKSNVAEKET